jgi:hypothetical protein
MPPLRYISLVTPVDEAVRNGAAKWAFGVFLGEEERVKP